MTNSTLGRPRLRETDVILKILAAKFNSTSDRFQYYCANEAEPINDFETDCVGRETPGGISDLGIIAVCRIAASKTPVACGRLPVSRRRLSFETSFVDRLR